MAKHVTTQTVLHDSPELQFSDARDRGEISVGHTNQMHEVGTSISCRWRTRATRCIAANGKI